MYRHHLYLNDQMQWYESISRTARVEPHMPNVRCVLNCSLCSLPCAGNGYFKFAGIAWEVAQASRQPVTPNTSLAAGKRITYFVLKACWTASLAPKTHVFAKSIDVRWCACASLPKHGGKETSILVLMSDKTECELYILMLLKIKSCHCICPRRQEAVLSESRPRNCWKAATKNFAMQ